MRTIDETIEELSALGKSPDICYACTDNALCESCVLADAMHYLQEYRKSVKWIRIDDGRPEQDGSYLTIVRYRDGSICQKIKLWKDGAFTSEAKQVTHWQPLPPEPEEE